MCASSPRIPSFNNSIQIIVSASPQSNGLCSQLLRRRSLLHAHPEAILYKRQPSVSSLARTDCKITNLEIHRQVRRKHPLLHLRIRRVRRPEPRHRLRRLHIVREGESRKILQKPDEEEAHLVVRELLPEADARAGVEGDEDVRVVGEVLGEALVDEAVRVEFSGWEGG